MDLNNTATCPKEVAISAGLDVLFHSLESKHLSCYSHIPDDAEKSNQATQLSRTMSDHPGLQILSSGVSQFNPEDILLTNRDSCLPRI